MYESKYLILARMEFLLATERFSLSYPVYKSNGIILRTNNGDIFTLILNQQCSCCSEDNQGASFPSAAAKIPHNSSWHIYSEELIPDVIN